jgi:hypothetical protein
MFRTNRALSGMDGVCTRLDARLDSRLIVPFTNGYVQPLYAPISVQNELTHLSLLGLARLRLFPSHVLIVDMGTGSEGDGVHLHRNTHRDIGLLAVCLEVKVAAAAPTAHCEDRGDKPITRLGHTRHLAIAATAEPHAKFCTNLLE